MIAAKQRVNDEEEGGIGGEFDPMTVLARTLWPEQQKLYGHVFEVFCTASAHKGDVAASGCKAKE